MSFNIADAMNPTEVEKNMVNKQATTYNLKGKLFQSINDCEIITTQKDLFSKIPYAFIVVTDINSDKNAIDDINANLASLAETASVWTYCDNIMKDLLNTVNINVKKVYTHCRDFDLKISQIGA